MTNLERPNNDVLSDRLNMVLKSDITSPYYTGEEKRLSRDSMRPRNNYVGEIIDHTTNYRATENDSPSDWQERKSRLNSSKRRRSVMRDSNELK